MVHVHIAAMHPNSTPDCNFWIKSSQDKKHQPITAVAIQRFLWMGVLNNKACAKNFWPCLFPVSTSTIYGHTYSFLDGAHHELSKESCKLIGEHCKLVKIVYFLSSSCRSVAVWIASLASGPVRGSRALTGQSIITTTEVSLMGMLQHPEHPPG